MFNLVPITSFHSLSPAHIKSAWYTLIRFWLFKNGIANIYDIYTIYGCCLGRNSSKHPLVGQCKRHKREQRHFI